MSEKTATQAQKQTSGNFIKERFSFELRVNDNIICQRYFRINGFKSHSLYSEELLDTLNYCAKLIQDDLKDKTQMFNWYTAPQVFKDEEEMYTKLKSGTFYIEPFRFICFEESDNVYFWDGEKPEKYEKYFNRNDYIVPKDAEQTPCILKLAFLDEDKEVCSTSWDGNVYPRFIRVNIDLSNSKNKYKQDGQFSPMECAMVTMLNEAHTDLIPVIIREFCVCCSADGDTKYTNKLKYGKKTYPLNMEAQWDKYVASLEKDMKKETDKYLKTIPF